MKSENTTEIFHRTAMLVGEDAMKRITSVRVILFGCGGVGSWAAEALARSGVRHITIVDPDVVSPTNINRQLVAKFSTVGRPKVDVLREMLLDINPDAEVVAVKKAFTAESSMDFDLSAYDFIIDAIDSLKHKAELILQATAVNSNFISSMGAALRLDPTKVRYDEFWKISGCRLAATLRRRFKRDGRFPAKKFECVYSEELPVATIESREKSTDDIAGSRRMRDNGSAVFVTATFGLTIASLVIRGLSENK